MIILKWRSDRETSYADRILINIYLGKGYCGPLEGGEGERI
jgi:hypothetical protein